MKAAVLTGAQRVEVREFPDPTPGPGEVLIRVRACGICGTDLHAYRGELPLATGVPLGHEMAGEIAALGEGVHGFSVGEAVTVEPLKVCRNCPYCLSGQLHLCPSRILLGTFLPGGMAQWIAAPSYSLYRLPPGMDYSLAALAEPLAVTVHALHLVGLRAGERVLVIGSGSVGLMAILAARAAGAQVASTFRYPQQEVAARGLGAEATYQDNEAGLARLRQDAAKEPFDVVVEAVGGRGATLQLAMEMARPGGRIAVLGLFLSPVPVGGLLLTLKEVQLVGALTYCRPPAVSDFQVALRILSQHQEDARHLISHQFPLEEADRAFAAAQDKNSGALKVQVLPWG